MKKALAIAALVASLTAFPSVALAATPEDASCWGAATQDFARSAPGALGEHSSSFDTPRLGLGNVAFLNTGTHQPGLLATALGFTCP